MSANIPQAGPSVGQLALSDIILRNIPPWALASAVSRA